MKTARDPRHLKRIETVKELFAWQFQSVHKLDTKNRAAQQIIEILSQIDDEIKAAASDYPLDHINKIDLAILRLAVFELLTEKDTPYKVIVDEAVELGKEFGSDSSSSFINGVLGNIIERKGYG